VASSNASRPAAESSAHGPRERVQLGGKNYLEATSDKAKKQDVAGGLSPMQAAFLAGLVDLAQREAGDESIALPTGPVEPGELRPSEIPAARRAYALHRAYPWLPTLKIAARLAHDHGLYDRRWKPYRCKRLRRMIDSYAECVNAGVEPSPETIFGDDGDAT
jgi:hypothetical protein